MSETNLKLEESKDNIISGLKYFQDKWSKDDPDFPYYGNIPDEIFWILHKTKSEFHRIKAGRLFLQDTFPEYALKRYSGEKEFIPIDPIIEQISNNIKSNQIVIKLEVYEIINNIENQEEREIFYDFYIEGKFAREIAEERELEENDVRDIITGIRTEIRQLYDME
jgi:hypothetical protein